MSISPTFDARASYKLSDDVALRPERFGALAYHYGNRRLTFIKSEALAAIVAQLESHPSVEAALDAHAIGGAQRSVILAALANLQRSDVIRAR